jgi:tape measure domain-containing protein
MSVGDLVANLTANTAGFSKGLNSARSQMGSFASGLMSQLAGVGLAFQGISAIGSVFRGIGGGATGLVQLAADAEQTAVSFEVMLGSAEQSTSMLAQMRQFAASTPMETKDITEAGKTLLQFGVDAQNVMPLLRMLGDVSGGNADRFKSLSLAFGQVSASGRLQGQDLLQMINSGFNPLKVISEQTGESMADLKAKMEAGGISTQMVVDAFKSATSEGGQFHGMMDKQSKTTAGLFSSLKDNVSLAMTDIGKALIDGFDLNGLMADTSAFLEMFRGQWLPGIVQGINTLGASFGMLYESIRSGWGQWISETAGLAIEFFANWDLYLAIAAEHVSLFATNTTERMRAFFTDADLFIVWWSDAWVASFTDILSASGTFFNNLIKGQESAKKLLNDIATGGIGSAMLNLNWVNALDGFESSIKQMPQLTQAAIQETTPALEGLYGKLAERQAEMAKKVVDAATPKAMEDGPMSAFDSSAKEGKAKKEAFSGAAEFGGKDAATIIASNASRGRDPIQKATEDTAKNTKAIVDHLKKTPPIIVPVLNMAGL